MGEDDLINAAIGPYEIIGKIGQGGMAEVYKGRHVALQRLVAIKILGRSLQSDARLTQRFQREAQSIAAMRHPNIVQIHDFGAYKGGHYLVMEYVEGTDLRQEMNRRREAQQPFSPEEILELVQQIAAALDHAHHQGVIHRDVKPGNILINKNGEAILGDFGLVMLRDRLSQATLGNTFGTPEYIAPEQATDSRAAVPQSDIYALGGIVYELVTGHLPFEADTAISLALKHIQEDPTPPRKHNPNLPQAVENVILRALAKEPQRRHATAQAFVDALRNAWSKDEEPTVIAPSAPFIAETPPPPMRMPPAVTPSAATAAPERTPPRKAQRTKRGLLPLLGIIIAIIVGGFLYLQSQNGGMPVLQPSATPSPTLTPMPTSLQTESTTLSPEPTTVSPTATASATSTPTTTPPSPTIPPSPTMTPSPTSTLMPSITPSPSPTMTPTPTPTLAPGTSITRELDGMVMQFIPAGAFLMGASEDDDEARDHEKPQHEVVLSAFWMGQTEVNTAQYKQCVASGGCEAPYTRTAYDNPVYDNRPMTYISWEDAAAYCQWLASETGWDVQLPTEAQWEKAASWDPLNETKRRYPWGNELNDGYAHIGGSTAIVGSYPQGASAYGVRDLAGNAWEWVNDWYDGDFYNSAETPRDPTGPETGRDRVLRGGNYDSWGNAQRQLRTTYREIGAPASTSDRPAKGPGLSFRCVVNAEWLGD